MERLPQRDLRTLVDVVRETYTIRPPDIRAQHLLQILPRLIAVQHLVCIDSDRDDSRVLTPQVFAGDPPDMLARQGPGAVRPRGAGIPVGRPGRWRWRGEAARVSDYRHRRNSCRGRACIRARSAGHTSGLPVRRVSADRRRGQRRVRRGGGA